MAAAAEKARDTAEIARKRAEQKAALEAMMMDGELPSFPIIHLANSRAR